MSRRDYGANATNAAAQSTQRMLKIIIMSRPKCAGYFRIHAYRRIEMLIDEGTFEEWDKEMEFVNPLAFPGYEKKISAVKEKSGMDEAVVTGRGKIYGQDAVIAVCDSRFLMSGWGIMWERRLQEPWSVQPVRDCRLSYFFASGGARMQEGLVSLMQMAKDLRDPQATSRGQASSM